MTTKPLYESLRTIRLYGEMGVRFGRVHRLAVESSAEAIRALCVLLDGFEAYLMNARDRGVGFAVFIGKRNIPAEQLHFAANNDIRIAPIIMGSKNGGIFSIIIGVALIGISFLLPGAGLLAAGLFNAGLAMALGGVVQLLSPQPKDPKSKEKVENEPNYAFNGPVNTQAQGGCVPVLYGWPWCGSAVVSAGISADVYYPPDDTMMYAQEVLSKLALWYPMDDAGPGLFPAYDATGTEVTGGWNNPYMGGGHGGLNVDSPLNGAMMGTSPMWDNAPQTFANHDEDWDFTVVVDVSDMMVIDDRDDGVMVGRANNYGFAGFPFYGVLFVHGDLGTTVNVFIHDDSVGFIHSPAIAVPVNTEQRILVRGRYTAATRTMSARLNASAEVGAAQSSVAMREDGAAKLYYRNMITAEPMPESGVMRVPVDEWAVFNGAHLSDGAERYLYNFGQFKTLAQVIADAAGDAGSGQGTQGGDAWHEALDRLDGEEE